MSVSKEIPNTNSNHGTGFLDGLLDEEDKSEESDKSKKSGDDDDGDDDESSIAADSNYD